jgi:hypothetical protein
MHAMQPAPANAVLNRLRVQTQVEQLRPRYDAVLRRRQRKHPSKRDLQPFNTYGYEKPANLSIRPP